MKLLGFLFVTKVQLISLRLQIDFQTLIVHVMNCLNIKILIALIGVFLINTQPFTTTAFSLKKVKVTNVTLRNPWINKGLLKSVTKNNWLYKRFLAKPSSHPENLYKCFKTNWHIPFALLNVFTPIKKLHEHKSNSKSLGIT